MDCKHAISAYWTGGWDEAALEKWAKSIRARLSAPKVTFGLVFMSPGSNEQAAQAMDILRLNAQIPVLVGCTSASLIAGDKEQEDVTGLVLGLYYLPDADIKTARFTQEQLEESNGPGYWCKVTGVAAAENNGWLAFVDPYHMDGEGWLKSWNEAYPGKPIMGGLSSGNPADNKTLVFLNGDVFDSGGVAISFGGGVEITGVVSQGCTPIGETWTITKTERNLILKIANRPAYEVLLETFQKMPPDEQQKTRGNVLIGLATNEYLDEFHRGDFLVRNLLGADPKTGIIAVGALPRSGQTIQFQRRDMETASEDMRILLKQAGENLMGVPIYGACLCSCNGRGKRFFGKSNHDAESVSHQFGSVGLTGFFCNGEIGPVGNRSFLHGYTASLALFVSKNKAAAEP